MAVRRIIANLPAADPARTQRFYGEVLGLDVLMDHGWIITYGNATAMQVQLSIASEGGSGTPVPDISMEVDDINAVLSAMRQAEFEIVYGPADEPWGVRRFFVRDPAGKLVNILQHIK
jgi:catechol 2,3-dioxygenase-like lactoylglutathione lyase family enzyme